MEVPPPHDRVYVSLLKGQALVSFPRGYITAAGLQALSLELTTDTTVTELDLCRTGVTDVGATSLAAALRNNDTLRTLKLDENRIGDEGAVALADALGINSTLRTLSLRQNPIEETGAQSLADALRVNRGLRRFYITQPLDRSRMWHDSAQASTSLIDLWVSTAPGEITKHVLARNVRPYKDRLAHPLRVMFCIAQNRNAGRQPPTSGDAKKSSRPAPLSLLPLDCLLSVGWFLVSSERQPLPSDTRLLRSLFDGHDTWRARLQSAAADPATEDRCTLS